MLKNKTILIVEHDQDIFDIVDYILSEAGYIVQIVSSASEVGLLSGGKARI